MMALECDFSGYELPADIYADDIGAVENLGDNFRSVFFAYSRSEGGILKKVPVLCLVRPKSGIMGGQVLRWLRQLPDPRKEARESLDS
jgi:hypothetical protein